MAITDIPRAVLRVQYRLARTPLQIVEDRVVSRLDAEAEKQKRQRARASKP